jgi:hypothetical protein
MDITMTFEEIIDAFDKLSIDEQETLVEIIYHRLVEAGRIQPAMPEEIMKDIRS